MNNSTLRALPQSEDKPTDPLTDLLRAGARNQIAQAGEAELQALLEHHAHGALFDSRRLSIDPLPIDPKVWATYGFENSLG